MAEKIADLVRETSTSSGTGDIELDGAKPGFRSFVEAIGDDNTCRYYITDGTDFEIGKGTVTDGSPPTLSRDEVEISSNGNSLVDFGTAEKDVYHVVSAKMVEQMYQSGVSYGVRWDQANDIMEKGVLVSGEFVPMDYSRYPIQETLARVLRDA
ncbi:MAG: hypothetical protein ACOCUC_01055, partial [bacterium]